MEKTAFDLGVIDAIEKLALSPGLLRRARDAAKGRVKNLNRAFSAAEDAAQASGAGPVGLEDKHVRSIFSRAKDRSMSRKGKTFYRDQYDLMNTGAERARTFDRAADNAFVRNFKK